MNITDIFLLIIKISKADTEDGEFIQELFEAYCEECGVTSNYESWNIDTFMAVYVYIVASGFEMRSKTKWLSKKLNG